MKKLMLTLLAAGGFAAAANAQAGSILGFGDINFSNEKQANDDKHTTFNFTPGAGYQFDNHWTAGIMLGYGLDATKNAGAPDWTKVSNYRVGAFGRYTQGLGHIFSVFGQLEAGYETGKTKIGSTDVPGTKYNGFYANFFPAVGVNVYKGFALNFGFGGLSFEDTKVKGANSSKTTFGLDFGQQYHVGISKNFGGHHARRNHHEMGDDTRVIDTSDDSDDMPRKKKAHHSDEE